ncbi:MAG: hypothetical protein JXA99_03755 [Candidatus Lokiarchaeota archaeon]|nr:hypothetical protein [Candidatus Lokiarchaeota archaeon]
MKKFFLNLILTILFFLTFNIFPQQRIPIIIYSQKNIFNKISKDIAKVFPDNVEILVYDIPLLNGDEKINKKINDNFYNIITTNQSKFSYIAKFERDIIKENNIDKEFIKKQSELDLIAFGNFLNLDVVLFSSATIIEDQTKKIWNTDLKKMEYKKIILFQGDFISTENNLSIFRFSYYFLLD